MLKEIISARECNKTIMFNISRRFIISIKMSIRFDSRFECLIRKNNYADYYQSRYFPHIFISDRNQNVMKIINCFIAIFISNDIIISLNMLNTLNIFRLALISM